MPNIIACFKWVVDEAYIRKTPSGGLDFSAVEYKISNYDRNAIEAAAVLRDALGGSAIGLTVGTPEATKGIKDALSRGTDTAYFIADPSFSSLDPGQTASIIADVMRTKIQQYDLIICGEGTSDFYTQQVGPRIAETLGIPCISFVQKITIEGTQVTAERKVEDGIEIVSAPLPAVVTVLPEINVPRIPGVKDTLMASKKPSVTVKKMNCPRYRMQRFNQ
jgi:electron transfer flavoprotein beta subunit